MNIKQRARDREGKNRLVISKLRYKENYTAVREVKSSFTEKKDGLGCAAGGENH